MEHTDETTAVNDSNTTEDAPVQQPTPEPEQPDIDTLIREAEERGYLRGRNEQIALAMKQPAHWESPGRPEKAETEPMPTILANMRRSVWD